MTHPDGASVREVTLASPPEMEPYHRQVLAGEYDIQDAIFRVDGAPVILDLGACCGFFSFWASRRWPGARIFAYEASPKNFEYLKENAAHIPNIEISCHAVMTWGGRTKLFRGKQNPGQCSLYPELGEQTQEFEDVSQIEPKSLESCHILKCDTEGAEVDIITNYVNAVCAPHLIMFEYHGDGRRRELDRFLQEREYVLAGGHIAGPHRGTLKYVRQS